MDMGQPVMEAMAAVELVILALVMKELEEEEVEVQFDYLSWETT